MYPRFKRGGLEQHMAVQTQEFKETILIIFWTINHGLVGKKNRLRPITTQRCWLGQRVPLEILPHFRGNPKARFVSSQATLRRYFLARLPPLLPFFPDDQKNFTTYLLGKEERQGERHLSPERRKAPIYLNYKYRTVVGQPLSIFRLSFVFDSSISPNFIFNRFSL